MRKSGINPNTKIMSYEEFKQFSKEKRLLFVGSVTNNPHIESRPIQRHYWNNVLVSKKLYPKVKLVGYRDMALITKSGKQVSIWDSIRYKVSRHKNTFYVTREKN